MSPSPSPALAALRDATRDLHAELDRRSPLGDDDLDDRAYLDHAGRILGWLEPLERALRDNRIGRRCMLLHSFLWSGLALLGLGVFHAGSEATILGLFGAYALFIGGAQVLQLVYPNELFPTEIRAFAVGVGTSLSRVGAAVGTYLVPLSLETLGTAQTMYAAALVTLLGLLVTWALAPETRSLNLQQAASLT